MFSVIISTYNGSDHILSTIDNVKRALKKFNYEMIIVNDGSVDNTSKLLETFKNDNHFKILNQKNKGISASRNRGMRHISQSSKYVVFIDDSDQVKENFFEKIDAFFHEHDDIYVAATPLIRTKKGSKREHSLNYRFHHNKQIVDIHTDYQFIQFHIGGMVFRKELLVNFNYRFDEDLNFWEDAKFINTIILDTEKYGLITDTAYFYNSENPNSLSRVAWKLEERYIPLIENSYMFLIQQSNKKFNQTIKYTQFLVATHYSEYLKFYNQHKIINNSFFDIDKFEDTSKKLFRHIDTDTIYHLKISTAYKNYMLNLKGECFDTYRLSEQINVYIHSFNILSRNCIFSFSDESYGIPLNAKVYLEYSTGRLKEAKLIQHKTVSILGQPINDFSKNFYKIKIPLISLFFRSRMLIDINDIKFSINNPSIISRILKIVRKQINYRRK